MEKGISKVLLREIRRFSDCSTKCDIGSVFVTGSPILPGAQTPARTRRRTSSLETSSSSGKIENTLISSQEIAGRSRGTDTKKSLGVKIPNVFKHFFFLGGPDLPTVLFLFMSVEGGGGSIGAILLGGLVQV